MSRVGSGIINVITESLYDNPIVVFREYVQNSVDSIYKTYDDGKDIRIFFDNNSLYFADNGGGVEESQFDIQMGGIAYSEKSKRKNLGYKGIGRLSGLPYCECLRFINILDYKNSKFQQYSLDGKRYAKDKNLEESQNLTVEEFLKILSEDKKKIHNISDLFESVPEYIKEYYEINNKGFLVIMDNISAVLKNIIESEKFERSLAWLLPVDFLPEVYNASGDIGNIIKFLRADNKEGAPARSCKISYNNKEILRPISVDNFRNTVFKNSFEYAVGMITFNVQKIQIDKNNDFSGIRIYIDNILLCDESELIPALANYGFLNHSINGMIQAVRGIGAMIYITDKTNISANSRRTFIEITDNDSLEFLRYLAEFVNDIYEARYALSDYASAVKDKTKNKDEVEKKKNIALAALCKFVSEVVAVEEIEEQNKLVSLTSSEIRAIIKKSITSRISKELKEFIKQYDVSNMEFYYDDFISWLETHK